VIRHTTRELKAMVTEIEYKVNVNNLERDREDKTIGLNEIGRVRLRTTQPLFFDGYRKNRITGSVIIVDEATNNTVGVGMII